MTNIQKHTIVGGKNEDINLLQFQKLKNFPENTQKPKIQKIKKSCKDSSNEKYFENKLQEQLENTKNDIFKNFKN